MNMKNTKTILKEYHEDYGKSEITTMTFIKNHRDKEWVDYRELVEKLDSIWDSNKMRGSCEFRKGLLTMRNELKKEMLKQFPLE